MAHRNSGTGFFPEDSTSKQGRTRSGKKVLEQGYSTPSFEDGGGKHLTPENITDGIPMKDTPHPNTGSDILGGY